MRPLWFVAGAGVGVYAMVKARRAAEALTREGLADRLSGLRLGWEMFSDDVRTGMAEKEIELRAGLIERPDGPAELPSATSDTAARAHRTDTESGDGPDGLQ